MARLAAALCVAMSSLFAATLILSATGLELSAQVQFANPSAGDHAQPIVRAATRTDHAATLRSVPPIPPAPAVLGKIFVKPSKQLPDRVGSPGLSASDPVLQDTFFVPSAPATGTDFEGVGNVNGVLPPDPVGDIGLNHYVQMVNLSFAIWDRNGNLLYGPVDTNTLWQGFGGPCESTNDGDPIVLYDHLADRWMLSQFALPNYPKGPFYQCIAVSQGSDPTTSGWHRYEFRISNTKVNDYPKFGVWPDGYYMTVNQFKCNPRRCSWGGQGVVAFERDEMLNGGQARMVYFDLNSVDPNLGGMLPSDLDGPVPPVGAPNPFVQFDDNAWGYSPDQLQVWNFHVDWNNPSNSTFTFDSALLTAAFDSNMCGYARNCIPQPGGNNVDAIADQLMNRLQYRNFGAEQTMVVNHTVDVDGTDHAGVRWYELSNNGSGWTIAQQGTYAPDGDHRWMGSAAMNGAGDIALGYSVSGATTDPSIRFTGRLDGDAPGVMTQGEGEIIAGSGYQTHSSGRWGDYSSLSVDPMDDCTFWYTQEYYAVVVGSALWQTRIGSFKLAECGPVDNPPNVDIIAPIDGVTVNGIYRVLVSASDDNAVTMVELSIDDSAYVGITANFDGLYYFYDWTTAGYPDGNHTLRARATDDAVPPQSNVTGLVNVNVDNVNDPPVATFNNFCSGLSCNFDASGSFDPEGTTLSYGWNFGDGSPDGSGVTPNHTYAAAGEYDVVLTVIDLGGAIGTDTQKVTVSDLSGVGVDGITPNSMPAGATVSVTIAGSGFVGGASVTFRNGDGPTPTASNVVVLDASTIMATVTAKSGGPRRNRVWDVVVTNPDSSEGVLAGGFTVIR